MQASLDYDVFRNVGAVTRRGDSVPTSSKSSALRDEFNAHYQILTSVPSRPGG